MGYTAITQIILVAISVVIIVTYIQPKFYDIRDIQNETDRYKEAVENAAQFNAKLDELLVSADGFNSRDIAALDRYLPEEIDSIGVARDVQFIVEDSGMSLTGVSYEKATQPLAEDVVPAETVPDDPAAGTSDPALDPALDPTLVETVPAQLQLTEQIFKISAIGTYDQLKALLENIERNAYPLSIQTLTTEMAEGDTGQNMMSVEISLTAYALPSNL